MARFLICFLALLALGGCEAYNGTMKALRPTPVAITSLILLDGASVINTQKTIDDHFVSLVTGMDCSTIRASKGGHYCEEETDSGPVAIRTSYCYKSIARVSCFDQPLNRDASQLYGIRVDRIPMADMIPLPTPAPRPVTTPPPAPVAVPQPVASPAPLDQPVRITPLP